MYFWYLSNDMKSWYVYECIRSLWVLLIKNVLAYVLMILQMCVKCCAVTRVSNKCFVIYQTCVFIVLTFFRYRLSALGSVHLDQNYRSICHAIPNLTSTQMAICNTEPSALLSVIWGTRQGFSECERQFVWERWNCSTNVRHIRKTLKKSEHFFAAFMNVHIQRPWSHKNDLPICCIICETHYYIYSKMGWSWTYPTRYY